MVLEEVHHHDLNGGPIESVLVVEVVVHDEGEVVSRSIPGVVESYSILVGGAVGRPEMNEEDSHILHKIDRVA